MKDCNLIQRRRTGLTDHVLALEALALLLTIEHTRRRHAEARLTEAMLMLAEAQKRNGMNDFDMVV